MNINASVQTQAPKHLLPWLTYEGFLTKKLHQLTGDTSMQILSHAMHSRLWWDQYMLGVTCASVVHRDIVMYAQQQACWYARSIIPQTTYDAAPQWFARLKTELLGTLLFESTHVHRQFLIHYPIDVSCIEYHWVNSIWHQNTPRLWARLSLFHVHHEHPLFLLEVLLPGLERFL